jgi:predicted HAD superfamily phosphohydrolase YqeG
MTNPNPPIVYVDVDDTLVRSVGTKRIPMPRVVDRVRSLHRDGATLYLWSSGGAEYAKDSAEELGISDLFTAFLPKPTIIIDDQPVSDWRYCEHSFPMSC